LGLFAIQLANYVGAVPIAVVSSPEREEVCRSYGADLVINRSEMKHSLIDEAGKPNILAWREWKRRLTQMGVDAPDVVFEHVGRETLAASIYLARRGGRIVTCAASSGYESFIDLRYLWMNVKSLIGSHISNRQEAKEAHALIDSGAVRTTVTDVAPFYELPDLLNRFRLGEVVGKAVVSISEDGS
jgi:crotonyl-CoA reductase